MKGKKAINTWLITGALLVFLMVAIGGITRLTHSGLSMTDWNLVMGSIPPLTESEWQNSFESYQTSPEFKELNSHFELEDYKSIFWWEYIHRLIGRFIGVVFIIPFVFFWLKGWLSKNLIKQLVILLFLGGFQGFLGWFMVKSGLVDVPRVSHYRLAAHLSMAFITCLYILWLYLNLNLPKVSTSLNGLKLRKPFLILFALTFIQVIYGAFVAGLKAGWVHNTYPLMDGQVMSDAALVMEPIYLNFIEGKSGVQFVHRTLALLIVLGVGYYYFKGMRSLTDRLELLAVRLAFVAVLFQFSLGVATLMLQVPIEFGVLHQLGALLLLASLLFAVHRFRVQEISKQ
jgi:cytochrome c oxidase assembly protein subunit 15